MTRRTPQLPPSPLRGLAATALALSATGLATQALASEGYKLRQSPVGAFGGEMATPADNPGFFGTVVLSVADIYKVVDGQGNRIGVPARTVPLPLSGPTKGAVGDGVYSLSVPTGTVDFSQRQNQVNLLGGYLTESTYGGGRIAFAINVPLISQERTFIAAQPLGTVTPTPSAALPAALRGAISQVADVVNAQVQAGVAAQSAAQSIKVSGVGDAELSAVWVHHEGHLKVAAGASLFLPTGSYDAARGPNPGFGNFYTLRPGVAVSYSVNPDQPGESWTSGVTVAGRVSVGLNTKNKDTQYLSGNYVYMEFGAVKVMGNWALGANVLGIQQFSDDSGTGAAALTDGNRYRNFSWGPFLSYKLPGKEAGFNLHYSQNFGGRNTLVTRTTQLRFIKAW